MLLNKHQAPPQPLPAISTQLKDRTFLLFIMLTLAFITLAQIPVTYALVAQLSCLNAAVYFCISLNPKESEDLFKPKNAPLIINTAIATLVVLMCKILCIAALPGIYNLCVVFFPAIISLLNTYPQYTLLLTLLFQATDYVIYQPCTNAFQPTTERLNVVPKLERMEESPVELPPSSPDPDKLTPPDLKTFSTDFRKSE